MDTDLLKNIITIIPSIIALVVTMLTLFPNRTRKMTDSVDSRLTVVVLKRSPFEDDEYRKIRNAYLAKKYLLFLLYIFVQSLILKYLSEIKLPIDISNLINIITVILSIFVYNSYISYKQAFISSHDARYYLFKGIDIVIEGDFKYLFNKCQEVMRKMKYQLMEIDEKGVMIEACQISSWRRAGVVTIKLVKEENTENSFKVVFTYSIVFFMKYFLDISSAKSKVTNDFVSLLISEPKDMEENTKDK